MPVYGGCGHLANNCETGRDGRDGGIVGLVSDSGRG